METPINDSDGQWRQRRRGYVRLTCTLLRALSKNILTESTNHTISSHQPTSHQPPATNRPLPLPLPLPVTSHQTSPASLYPCSLSPQALARRPRSLFAGPIGPCQMAVTPRPALAGGDPDDWFLSRQPLEPTEAVWYACRENGEN